MAETKEKNEDIAVVESQDGTATVDLPENLFPEQEIEQIEAKNDGGSVADEDLDHPDDDEDLRAAKRNRRRAKKELIRKTNQEKDAQLAALRRENDEFKRRLSQLERNTKSEQIVRIDKSIEDAQVRLEYAKMKLAEATSNNDGQAMVEAQTLWRNAEDEVKNLNIMKQRADAELRRAPQQADLPNPQVQRLAADWIRRNPWYDPANNDPDSRVAKKIDELMMAQGLDPSTREYWTEFDARLQRELPHRYNESDDDDFREVRRPRNVVGSSGREAPAAYGGVNRNQFTLSAERVKAMKEAGAWDNPERKAKMIKQFIAYDRANGIRN